MKKAENAVNLIKNMLNKDDLLNLSAMTNEEAAENGDIVILTVPLQAQMVTLKSIKDNLMVKYLLMQQFPLRDV